VPDTTAEARKPAAHLMTLGCARNEVDSEELAARLVGDGWRIAGEDDPNQPGDVVVINTCGFVAAAKQESIDEILAAADDDTPVVAVGCLAERYGEQLAAELPEAAAVIGFDGYDNLPETLRRVAAGEAIDSHAPRDRRELLPISPVERPDRMIPPGHAGATVAVDLPGTNVLRTRLDNSPVAPLKIASGCDRRCAFCAIPRFRGSFLSRKPGEILAEARWLAEQGVRELDLVSENSTSYGKDLGQPRLLEELLPELDQVAGIDRIRVTYLQPAELRPGLIEAMVATPAVANYFDISFQHASGPLLRRMRRFGDHDSFLELISHIRSLAPDAGIRSNVIVGFPGETDEDLQVLEQFLTSAELDAVGVFGYSPEDGTEAAELPGEIDPDEISARVEQINSLVEHLTAQRAQDRIGATTKLLVTATSGDGASGSAEFQGPEDGDLSVSDPLSPGDLVSVRLVSASGVDLAGEVVPE
jgi:ribosomal protein S12 methylthiotransferase